MAYDKHEFMTFKEAKKIADKDKDEDYDETL